MAPGTHRQSRQSEDLLLDGASDSDFGKIRVPKARNHGDCQDPERRKRSSRLGGRPQHGRSTRRVDRHHRGAEAARRGDPGRRGVRNLVQFQIEEDLLVCFHQFPDDAGTDGGQQLQSDLVVAAVGGETFDQVSRLFGRVDVKRNDDALPPILVTEHHGLRAMSPVRWNGPIFGIELPVKIHKRREIFYGGEPYVRLHGGCRLDGSGASRVRLCAFSTESKRPL